MFTTRRSSTLPTPEQALPGRAGYEFEFPEKHVVLDAPVRTDEVPDGLKVVVFGLGCYWGAEEIFWQLPGVWSTSVGFAGGTTPYPTYEEVCTGRTGHTEAVRVVYDPEKIDFRELVAQFFEVHDPTQGMRQGNDVGTQYRSAIFTDDEEQLRIAAQVAASYQPELTERGYGEITTEIKPIPAYYYASPMHQQYLAKVPDGYRCHAKTDIPVPRTW